MRQTKARVTAEKIPCQAELSNSNLNTDVVHLMLMCSAKSYVCLLRKTDEWGLARVKSTLTKFYLINAILQSNLS